VIHPLSTRINALFPQSFTLSSVGPKFKLSRLSSFSLLSDRLKYESCYLCLFRGQDWKLHQFFYFPRDQSTSKRSSCASKVIFPFLDGEEGTPKGDLEGAGVQRKQDVVKEILLLCEF
jgi:hypothetical protein